MRASHDRILLNRWISKNTSTAFMIGLTLLNGQEMARADEPLKLSYVMKKAAIEYPTVLAQGKSIEAAALKEKSILLNSLTLTGSISKSKSNMDMSVGDVRGLRANSDSTSSSIGIQLLLSLATWFQAKGVALDEQMERNALRAMQMQLAADAAKAYIVFYSNESRLRYLRLVATSLDGAKRAVGSGKLKLGPNNIGALEQKIYDIGAMIGTMKNNTDVSAIELRKYLGGASFQLPVTPIEPTLTDAERARVESGNLVDWGEVESVFPIPPTPDDALAQARTSPALIKAGLSEQVAENQWYLTAAGYGPYLVFSFERSFSDTNSTIPDMAVGMNGNTFTARLGFDLGAGIGFDLAAADALKEMARYHTASTELEIWAEIEKHYRNVEYAHKQMVTHSEAVAVILKTLKNGKFDTDSEFGEFLDLVDALTSSSAQLTDQSGNYLFNKIDLHGLMGTLMEEADRLETIGQ